MNSDWIKSIKNSLALVKNVHDFLSFVRENWENLPKSSFNDEKVVIFRCIEQYDGGWGHHSYTGYGVAKNGDVVYCYSSGCSCNGHAEVDSRGPLPTEKDLKIFSMADGDVDPFDFSKVDFDSLVVSYSDY